MACHVHAAWVLGLVSQSSTVAIFITNIVQLRPRRAARAGRTSVAAAVVHMDPCVERNGC